MNVEDRTVPFKYGFFNVSYCIYLFFALLSTTFFYQYYTGTPYKIIKAFCLLLLFLKELFRLNITRKLVYSLCSVCFICIILIYNTGYLSNFVLLLSFVYCGRDMSFGRIARITIALSWIVLCGVITCSYMGIVENYISYSSMRTREYLGFLYCLYPSAILFNITALTLFLHNDKQSVIELVILSLANWWLFQKTDSRLSFFLSIIMIIAVLLFQLFPKEAKKFKLLHYGMTFSFLISAIISIYLTINYDGSIRWMKELNTFLGGRLYLGNRSINQYGISLFGKKNIEWIGNGLDVYGNLTKGTYSWVDSFYVATLQRFGILVSVLIVFLFTMLMIKCLKQKQYNLMVILTFISLHFIVDDLFMYLHYNTFWFLIGTMLIGNTDVLKELSHRQILNQRRNIDYAKLRGRY